MNPVYSVTQVSNFSWGPLGSVCQWLCNKDIKGTHLARRYLNEAAPFVLRRVWLSSSSGDQKTLTAIFLHRIFSKHIREKYYDGTTWSHSTSSATRDVTESRTKISGRAITNQTAQKTQCDMLVTTIKPDVMNKRSSKPTMESNPRGYQMILRPILDLSYKPRRRATD